MASRKIPASPSASSSSKPILPLLANLTTLKFDSQSIALRYSLQKQAIPTALPKAQQLADIAWVDPEAKAYLERVEHQYEVLKAQKRSGASGRGRYNTRFSLKNLARQSPFALAELLDIMADPYHLPLPYQLPIAETTYAALKKQFKRKDQPTLCSLDEVLHKFLNHPPQWHLHMATVLEQVAAYLDLKSAINDFRLGKTSGIPDERARAFSRRLWSKAHSIRQEFRSNLCKNWKPFTSRPDFVLTTVIGRLRHALKALTGQPGYTFITAMIQTAPYTPAYRHYRLTNEEAIKKRTRTSSFR